jgi:hypothetical protein
MPRSRVRNPSACRRDSVPGNARASRECPPWSLRTAAARWRRLRKPTRPLPAANIAYTDVVRGCAFRQPSQAGSCGGVTAAAAARASSPPATTRRDPDVSPMPVARWRFRILSAAKPKSAHSCLVNRLASRSRLRRHQGRAFQRSRVTSSLCARSSSNCPSSVATHAASMMTTQHSSSCCIER